MSCTCAAPHRPIALFGQRQRGESCYRNLLSPPTSRPTLLITISLIMCTLLHFNSSRHGSLEMGSWRKLEAGVSFLEAPFLIGSNNRNQVNVSVQFTCWFAGTLRAAASAPATVLNLSSSSSECVNILAASLLDTIAICPTVAHRKRFLIKSPNWTELNCRETFLPHVSCLYNYDIWFNDDLLPKQSNQKIWLKWASSSSCIQL